MLCCQTVHDVLVMQAIYIMQCMYILLYTMTCVFLLSIQVVLLIQRTNIIQLWSNNLSNLRSMGECNVTSLQATAWLFRDRIYGIKSFQLLFLPLLSLSLPATPPLFSIFQFPFPLLPLVVSQRVGLADREE